MSELVLTDLNLLKGKQYRWSVRGKTDFRAYATSYDSALPDYHVPEELLSKAHPDLPEAIRKHIAWTRRGAGRNYITSLEAFMTVSLYTELTYYLRDMAGAARTIQRIIDFRLTNNGRDAVIIDGNLLTLEKGNTKGKTYHFVAHRESRAIAVYSSVLDQAYPGWRTRWDLAKDMGMGLNERIPYTLSQTVEVDVSAELPSITFE